MTVRRRDERHGSHGRDRAEPVPLRRRIYGFGSVFGKTIRDSRRAMIARRRPSSA